MSRLSLDRAQIPTSGGDLGQWPFCSVSISSSIKCGDESYPGGHLGGGLKELPALCLLAHSKCSITATPKDNPPACVQALETNSPLAPIPTLDFYLCILASKAG